ncbi:hypothetical protein HOY80DRAFT_1002394 [Tuber brumale]|nr:hypothetical protein HOY80DRAFT_1002394 [Tuber brumale]
MAPSTASALNPIIIPAVQIPPHFSTLGSGLLHETHARESVSTLTALLLTSPDIFPNKAKPKPWWRGQCLLYGLDAPQSLAIQSLREKLENALRRGDLQIPEHLVELEHIENGKFRKLNAQVREATGVKKEGKGGGVKKDKEDPLKKVLGATKVAKKTPAGKTAAPAAAAKPRAKKKSGPEPEPEPEVKAKAKPRAKAQAPPIATAAAGGNIQIYLTALAPAPAPRARQTAKRGTSSAPKSRAPKAEPPSKPPAATAKRAGGGPGSRGGRGSRGGARGGRAAQSIKHEASSPPAVARGRTKQTARCSTRGGPGGTRGRGGWANGGISTARVKEEEEVHDGYGGWNDGGRGGDSDDDGYPYRGEYSGHSGHSGSEGEGIKGEYDDEDGYYGYGYSTAF